MDKKTITKELSKWLKANQPNWGTIISQKAGISNYKVQDGKEFKLMLDLPTHGIKGMCSFHLSLIVSNDEIFDIKNKSGVVSSVKFPVIFLGSSILYPNEYIERLWFRDTDGAEKQLNIVTDLINQYYFPIAKGLTINYNFILDNFDNADLLLGFHEPFITGVIMAFLCNREEWIYDILLPLTEKYKAINGNDSKERFAKDFRKVSNVEREIIAPVRKWFESR
ncbi:hypothetical protein L4X50_05175 [Phocaeicola vulgatus]|uniref:hypothetical protein n=1 Tax=Phocaeicola vulgatus TaxID=821 RepID=UPI001F1D85E5|nr:hypothetical protein [Phocaeicola vulgatus]MCG0201647.1 hypothetical protein [Phocaeicola vulgatus]